MTVTTIEEARGVLYGEDAAAFVAARNELFKAVRDDGDRELAAEIKKLRKPSVVAAELNRVVRSDTAGVAALLAAVEALRQGQADMLSGNDVDVAGLQVAYREAVQSVAQGASAHRVEIRAALEAAAVDADSQSDFLAGTFVAVPVSSGGFGFVAADLAAPPAKKAKPKPKPGRPDADVERAARVRELKQAKKEATMAHRAAVKAAREAASTRADAEKAVETVQAEVAAIEEALEAKRGELGSAAEALEIAGSADLFASKRAAQAQADLDRATAALDAHPN